MTKTTKTIWVLTQAYSDYDQHGDYIVACFLGKPTSEELIMVGVKPSECSHVLNGGGRIKWGDNWYKLKGVGHGEQY